MLVCVSVRGSSRLTPVSVLIDQLLLLAAAVDAGEGLLVQDALEAETRGRPS